MNIKKLFVGFSSLFFLESTGLAHTLEALIRTGNLHKIQVTNSGEVSKVYGCDGKVCWTIEDEDQNQKPVEFNQIAKCECVNQVGKASVPINYCFHIGGACKGPPDNQELKYLVISKKLVCTESLRQLTDRKKKFEAEKAQSSNGLTGTSTAHFKERIAREDRFIKIEEKKNSELCASAAPQDLQTRSVPPVFLPGVGGSQRQ